MDFPRKSKGRVRAIVLAACLVACPARAGITWPQEQILPSFPAPASTLDLIYIRGPETPHDEFPLFASLKGIVNRTEPRIFSYEGDAFAEGPYTWLDSLGLDYEEHDDNWALLTKYKSEIDGLVVYDTNVPHTMNLATTVAGQMNALVVAPSLVEKLTSAPYDFPILEDYRGDFANLIEVYTYLYNDIWPSLDHRVLIGLSPSAHRASLREYAHATKLAVVWLDPAISEQSVILNQFLSSMGVGATYMGWWPEEAAGIARGSSFGVATVASDYATNLTVHSGMPRKVSVQPIPPKPVLENKIYVAFILSDGDNLQYVEHLMRKLWDNPDRGKVPIGWTVSPAMLDAMPGALDFYHRTATPNDNLISGPSGWGYAYPTDWIEDGSLAKFAAVTDEYALRAGLRVVTVWNTITGGIEQASGNVFANYAPSLLGLTAQNTGGGLTIYENTLPGFALSCNYCTGETAMEEHIASAANGFDGTAPRFVLIQAQPWTDVRPTSFMNVANSLSDDYRVVRPDNWFQLLRQHNHLPIEPVKRITTGTYRLINEASEKCLTLGAATDGDRPVIQAVCTDDDTQRWTTTEIDSGYLKIASLQEPTLILDIAGGPGGFDQGRPLIVHTDLEGANQQWQPVWEADDDYHLLVRHSDQCLDVPNASTDDVQLRQWGCNGSPAQRFRFADPIWPPPTDDPEVPLHGSGGAGGAATGSGGSPAVDNPEMPPGAVDAHTNQEDSTGCACTSGPGRIMGAHASLGALLLAALALGRRRRSLRSL